MAGFEANTLVLAGLDAKTSVSVGLEAIGLNLGFSFFLSPGLILECLVSFNVTEENLIQQEGNPCRDVSHDGGWENPPSNVNPATRVDGNGPVTAPGGRRLLMRCPLSRKHSQVAVGFAQQVSRRSVLVATVVHVRYCNARQNNRERKCAENYNK